jgi:methionyl-tRNA formyltransferase
MTISGSSPIKPPMKILFLGRLDSPLISWLKASGESVVALQDKITADSIAPQNFEFLISYGYRFILKPPVLALFPNRAINLHIAFLPYNRGADPNFWSWVENTPKGVTIHHIDEGVDTGDIIAQRGIWNFGDLEKETLGTTYHRHQQEMQSLFKASWPRIKADQADRMPQHGQGSFHKVKDKERLAHLLLPDGWNTPVSRLRQL